MNNIVLSFLKEYNIPYKINRSDNSISYPCFYCYEETNISMIRTKWKCHNCNQNGTLVHLIEFIKGNNFSTIEKIKQVKIYNEKQEIGDIKKLLAKINDEKVALELEERLFKLLERREKKRVL